VYIVADISLNFQSIEDILEIIYKIKADMVKLQWYSEKDLYGSGSDETKLKMEWMPRIKDACLKNKKRLLCTVFSPERVREISGFVSLHKIASSEITDKNLLNEIKLCRKPTILSTGGASTEQINTAIDILNPYCSTLLACDVEYPSKRHSIRNMLYLKNMYPHINVGYSDHSLDICSMPILVSHYGATMYEKHVKPNDKLGYEDHALTLREFNEMVDTINGKAVQNIKNPYQRIFNSELQRWVRPRI
jgi:sialic acid synthase SpsE